MSDCTPPSVYLSAVAVIRKTRIDAIARALRLAESLPVAYSVASTDEKRRILNAVHSNRLVTDGIHRFSLAKPFDVLAERPVFASFPKAWDSNPIEAIDSVLNRAKKASPSETPFEAFIGLCVGWGSNPGPWA